MRLVVSSTGDVALDVARVQLQDLSGLFHEVMAWDPSGRAQQLFPGLMLVDDHIAGGVATPSSVTLRCDEPSGLDRM